MLDGGTDLPINKEMQIIGAGRRENVVCPGCGSTDRDRLLYTYLNNSPGLLKPYVKILHIAPEPGLSKYLQHIGKSAYVGGMKYHEGYYYSKNFKLFDILNLPFEKDYFELVVCNHVLEHIQDDVKGLREIYRVMKAGATAILQVPWSPVLQETLEDPSIQNPKEREKRFGQFDHVRLYGLDYPKRLQKAGFDVEIITLEQLNIKIEYQKKISLIPNEVIFIAKKPV
jgi:SAM-dependent methyltransferase